MEIDGETVETVSDFIFWGSKITEDGDCSHEIKKWLPLGRKSMTNIDSILKRRDIILPTKVCIAKAMVFQSLSMDMRVGEKAMATHSSILAWKIPWTEEPSGLQFMGL